VELEVQLAAIRANGLAVDGGGLDPAINCVAVPWPHVTLPAAIGCLGAREALDADAALVRRVLAAAIAPGATARDIIARAA
jgi:DNA-binding IclR family transcriptional regulator